MAELLWRWGEGPWTANDDTEGRQFQRGRAERLLDAIPGDVLAQLAKKKEEP
jgi:hypothetical protein